MRKQMADVMKKYQPEKSTFRSKFAKQGPECKNSVAAWIKEKDESCYICKRFADTYERYVDTFFVMYKRDPEFVEKVKNSKGFCLHHFGDLCEAGESKLNDKQKTEFYPAMFELQTKHMDRLQEDVSWLVEKFDYRNKDADWKNSRDAI